MLLHQLGTAHVHAMKWFEMSIGFNLPRAMGFRRSNGCGCSRRRRLMDVHQYGMLVHHKMRHGATQSVIVKQQVQHFQVNDGGQAVVTGTVKRGGRRTRKGQRS